MGPQYTRSLAEILHSTLQKLEESTDFHQEDPAVVELKKHIVLTIAELEVAKTPSLLSTREDPSDLTRDPPPEVGPGSNAPAGGHGGRTDAPAQPVAAMQELIAEPAAQHDDVPLLAKNETPAST